MGMCLVGKIKHSTCEVLPFFFTKYIPDWTISVLETMSRYTYERIMRLFFSKFIHLYHRLPVSHCRFPIIPKLESVAFTNVSAEMICVI